MEKQKIEKWLLKNNNHWRDTHVDFAFPIGLMAALLGGLDLIYPANYCRA